MDGSERIRPGGPGRIRAIEGRHEFPAAKNNTDCCSYRSSALFSLHSGLAAARFTRTMEHFSGRRPTHWRANLPAKGVQRVPFRSRRWSEAGPRSGFAGGGRIQHERVGYPDVEPRAAHVETTREQQNEFPAVYARGDDKPVCLPVRQLL